MYLQSLQPAANVSVYVVVISSAWTETIIIDKIIFSVDSTDSAVLIHSDEYHYRNSLLPILLGIICKYGLYMSTITMC